LLKRPQSCAKYFPRAVASGWYVCRYRNAAASGPLLLSSDHLASPAHRTSPPVPEALAVLQALGSFGTAPSHGSCDTVRYRSSRVRSQGRQRHRSELHQIQARPRLPPSLHACHPCHGAAWMVPVRPAQLPLHRAACHRIVPQTRGAGRAVPLVQVQAPAGAARACQSVAHWCAEHRRSPPYLGSQTRLAALPPVPLAHCPATTARALPSGESSPPPGRMPCPAAPRIHRPPSQAGAGAPVGHICPSC
jgi:hypothetical protein